MRNASFKESDLHRIGALSGKVSQDTLDALVRSASRLQRRTMETTEQTHVLRQCRYEEQRARTDFENMLATCKQNAEARELLNG